MSRRLLGLTVALVILAGAVTGWAQNPTNLTVIRKSDNSIWTRTCDGTSSCTDWAKIGGGFSVQPTLTWDPSIQKYILVGIGNNQTSIWRSTFTADGTWEGPWVNITGTSGGSPSPVGIAGGVLQPETITVNCSAIPPQSLQAAINGAQTGATINVTGTCNESLFISDEKTRLTLNGQSGAILHGPSSTDSVLNIRGREISIQNFEITGGSNGIWVNRGSIAVIDGNNIHNTGAYGIVIQQSSSAVITNNNIHDNPQSGIVVNENSTARIGFALTNNTSPSPNTIHNNAVRGIDVNRGSSARIVGNIITYNANDGIGVFRSAQADISDNTIDHNGYGVTPFGHGINVNHNGGIHLGDSDASTFLGQPNITTVNNAGYGINCSLGGYIRAYHFVTTQDSTQPIWGDSGQYTFAGNCPYSLTNP